MQDLGSAAEAECLFHGRAPWGRHQCAKLRWGIGARFSTSLATFASKNMQYVRGSEKLFSFQRDLLVSFSSKHPSSQEIGITTGSNPVIITVGADGRLLGFDPRANFEPLMEFGGITSEPYLQLGAGGAVFVGGYPF